MHAYSCLPCPHIQFASGYDPRQLKEDREPCLMPNPVSIKQAVTLIYPSPLKQLEEEGSRKNTTVEPLYKGHWIRDIPPLRTLSAIPTT